VALLAAFLKKIMARPSGLVGCIPEKKIMATVSGLEVHNNDVVP
jgi:hypothetical protein